MSFPNPTSPPEPGPRPRGGSVAPPAGATPQEKGKLVLIGVAFLLVTGLMVGMVVLAGSSPEPAGGAPPPGGVDAAPTEIEFRPVSLFPEEEAEEVEKGLRERMASFAGIVDGVPAEDPAPYAYLLDQVTANARVLNLQREGFDREADPAALLADPAAHRGKLLSVSGEILRLERLPWSGASTLVREIRRGVLRDGAGRLHSFSWPVANPLEPDPVAPGDGWAEIRGIYYKPWPVAVDGADPVPTPHLVLQRRPARDYPPVAIRDLDASWMEQVRDGTPAEMAVRDADPLFYLVNMARTLGPEGFEAWARERQAEAPGLRVYPPEDLTGRYAELLDRPEVWRFRTVSYTGFLVRPSEIMEVRPNPGNVERLWIGFLVDQDFAPAVWVYSHRSFLDMGLRNDDRVKVEGIFLKRVAYEPAGGPPMKRAGVIVAMRITPAPAGKASIALHVLLGIVAIMLLLAGGLAWAILQGRREDEAAARRRQETIARKRAARAGETLAPPSPGPGAVEP